MVRTHSGETLSPAYLFTITIKAGPKIKDQHLNKSADTFCLIILLSLQSEKVSTGLYVRNFLVDGGPKSNYL